ncbi:Cytochrome P450 4c3, partial [Stegodyphus mimosarum]
MWNHALGFNWTHLLLIITPILMIAFFLSKRRCLKAESLPGPRSRALILYCMMMKTVYCGKEKSMNPLCLLLQVASGLCQMFEREKLFRIFVATRPFVFFYKPETVEVVLSSNVTIEKSSEYQFLHPWLGTGLLTSKGDKWRFRRKLLTPSFHFRVLDDFIPIFDEQSMVLASKLQSVVNEPWVDIVPLITMCTLDIICQTAMGVRINAQGGGCSEYVKAIYEIGETFLHRALRPWLWSDLIFNCHPSGRKFKANLQNVHGFTRKVIKEKKEYMLQLSSAGGIQAEDVDRSPSQRKKRKAFLELLLELHLKNESFTEEDIREEVDTFMFEGHDTTAMAICWTLHMLGLHPEAQEKVFRELDDIFRDDPNRTATREDLTQMKYLECVIKETLRLYPSVPFIARELNDSIEVGKYKIPGGSVCFIFPWMLHRDPESFPEPEKFDPERFFPENSAGRHPYAYVPFSAGPRNCIGQKFAIMEEKTVLANILRRFRIVSLDPRDRVNVMPDLIIRNVDPLRIRFTPRC